MQALKNEVWQRKDRERLLEQRSRHLERERDCMQALWEAERSKHELMQKAMLSTLESAGSELCVRLSQSRGDSAGGARVAPLDGQAG